NTSVGILLVVVTDDQAIMIAIERAGDRCESNVGCAAVASLADDVGKLPFPLALADHRFISGRDAGSKAAGAANLRVRPRHVIRRAQIRAVRHIHATGRPDKDSIVARSLARHPILNRGSASRTGAMPWDERLGRR